MSSIALALVLAAAGVHAGWNRLLHDLEDRVAVMAVAGLTSCIVLSPALVVSPPAGAVGLTVISGLCQVGYTLCLTAAYRRGALSLAYPISRGTAPLLVTLGGWFVLSQRPGAVAIAGAAALFLGLWSLAGAGEHTDRRGAIGFAVVTGCFIAAYSLIDARAVAIVSPAGYLSAVMGIEGIVLTAYLRFDLRRLRNVLGPGIAIGVGTVAAYLLVLFAFQRADAGQVATVREVSVLIGLAIARDRPGRRAWTGAVLVVSGAVLAALG
jgi:drug/metabolite transporter (DMT)-like permease